VGVYDPRQNPSRIEFRADRLAEWLKRGARPSATVAELMKKSGIPLTSEPTAGEAS
jgi:small subunit ribosomal protein S16